MQVQYNLSALAVWMHQTARLHPTHTALNCMLKPAEGRAASSSCWFQIMSQFKGKIKILFARDQR